MPKEDICFALSTLYLPAVGASRHGRDVELQAVRYSGRPADLKIDIDEEKKKYPPRNIQTPENKSSIATHIAAKLPSERVTETQKGADKHKRILQQSYIYSFIPQKWIRHLLCAGTGR